MQIFEKYITVTTNDLDSLNHVNNIKYVIWVQDIAKAHWEIASSEILKKKYFWVLIEHTIAYKIPAVLNDEINIKTFVLKSEGVTSVRQVDFINALSNQLIATSKTTWCLLDALKKKPQRIPSEIIKIFE